VSRGCPPDASATLGANELGQKLRNSYGGGHHAANSQNVLSLNALKGRWMLFPACRVGP